MKITMINGQNHKGSTYHIGKILALKLAKEEDIEEVFLPKDMPHFCIGCGNCLIKGEQTCPHYEVLAPITEKIDRAELLIFTSPVYCYHATGSMKALLDHYAYRWMIHRPEGGMVKKQAVIVATAAGAGMKSTIKDITDSLSFWGIGKRYSIGFAVRAMEFSKVAPNILARIEQKTDAVARAVRRNQGKNHVSMKTRMWYMGMAVVNKKGGLSPVDKEHWKEKGWMQGKRPWKQ